MEKMKRRRRRRAAIVTVVTDVEGHQQKATPPWVRFGQGKALPALSTERSVREIPSRDDHGSR